MKKLIAFWNEFKMEIIACLIGLLLCVGIVVLCVVFCDTDGSAKFDTVQYNTYTVQRNLGMRW